MAARLLSRRLFVATGVAGAIIAMASSGRRGSAQEEWNG